MTTLLDNIILDLVRQLADAVTAIEQRVEDPNTDDPVEDLTRSDPHSDLFTTTTVYSDIDLTQSFTSEIVSEMDLTQSFSSEDLAHSFLSEVDLTHTLASEMNLTQSDDRASDDLMDIVNKDMPCSESNRERYRITDADFTYSHEFDDLEMADLTYGSSSPIWTSPVNTQEVKSPIPMFIDDDDLKDPDYFDAFWDTDVKPRKRHAQHLYENEPAQEPPADMQPPERQSIVVRHGLVDPSTSYRYPLRRRDGLGALQLARLVKVMHVMRTKSQEETHVTKRDIYYQDTPLFGRSEAVDRIVADVGILTGLQRADLGVVSSGKGIFAGRVRILGENIISGEATDQGVLVPSVWGASRQIEGSVDVILVVEKEAVFRNLCQLVRQLPEVVLVTGKGYPDLATREFVHRISEHCPDARVLGLADMNPFGVEILLTYRNGSPRVHEREFLGVPRLEWVGLFRRQAPANAVELPLTPLDRRKLDILLERDDVPDHWKNELRLMSDAGMKSELEVLHGLDDFVKDIVKRRD